MTDYGKYLPRGLLTEIEADSGKIQEIRITAEKNCALVKNGELVETDVVVSRDRLNSIVSAMCGGSVYAVQNCIARGFLTLDDGSRVGICGKTVVENGIITHIRDISSICIRIARQVIGAADKIINYIDCGGRIYNTLIVSPPGCGKTTVLRDAARQLGNRYRVCIADERSEIAACRGGISGNDVGKFTSVMDGVPKAEGISMLLRSMSPDIIITDETGSASEEQAIYELINCGAKIITTAHGYSENDILRRRWLGSLVKDGVFERVIILSNRHGIATVERVTGEGRNIYGA